MDKHQIQIKPNARSMALGWLSGSIDGFHFEAKVFDEGSKFGVNDGRVSKLSVVDQGNPTVELFSYDRGWDKEPSNDEQRELLRALLEYLEAFPASEHWEHLAKDIHGNVALCANMDDVTVTDSNQELVAFAQTVDFTPLFAHIKAFAKVKCSFYQPTISTNRGSVYITFMSNDITKQTGPFAAILERCYICSFSNGVFKDKDTGELGYWVIVSIQYKHKGGGSNGMEMVRASYRDGEWEFCDAGQSRR